ncbi:PREDICTED: uncharacterized protein LOC108771786 [Cyphomyrmex costatus]|uniref:uncharacterized protein LOC108771786 n=1 Tax=Cyphomyrmex costatus TaxID=456900 RepID=UPI0008522ADF|nr:PREDICTED: uncharacterized protein LOC108771786 [Cyphomyrmex costatus]
MYHWSDSTVVLNWIASPSRRWSVFVSHRIGEIQSLTDPRSWRHVRSEDNPADLLSRGLDPRDLPEATTWWHGPTFLQHNSDLWPESAFVCSLDDFPEQRKCIATVAVLDHSIVDELLNRHSRLTKACRIIAYCLRFSKSHRPREISSVVSHHEMLNALRIICKAVQRQAFPAEYKALSEGRVLQTSSNVLALSPFICKEGLIRVGGRLVNSELNYEARHPILLPRNHVLTRQIILQEHERNAHAGVQATMAAVRYRYWPIGLRSAVRKLIRSCMVCFKSHPTQSEAIMAALPAGRVTASRPFMHCGVDYAGPFIVRESKRRNARTHKARSSRNSVIFLHNEQAQLEVAQLLRDQETDWKFIPPNAPHFGGLWEAAVKSAKRHLSRVAGKASLTFEELQTTFCEIEAIFNSRPFTPLSEDPNDLSFLSPGHFLIGTALNSFPYHDLTNVNENRLLRWQRVEQTRQHFWRRWSQEYLNTLQERGKWRANKGEQLQPNQMVLIKQQGLAPLQWLLGRVEKIHAGSDGVARAATVRTANGQYTRPLTKIAILPIDK